MKNIEVNFDGLVGPTHNYAGLSLGNVASVSNANQIANPKAAAKQGLQKAKALADMGLTQGILAPQARPDIDMLRRLGFSGSNENVLKKAATISPVLLQNCASASSMWSANAATVSPSVDTLDNKLHFTPANLINKFHRSLEPETTGRILQAVFNDPTYFSHHTHLPLHPHFGDEGAANHTRLCKNYDDNGIELFVYGQSINNINAPKPQLFPARQTLEASQAVARLHQLTDNNTVFIQQNPAIIDQGVFHNDVISVGNQNVLFFHELAFLDTAHKFAEIEQKLQTDIHFIKVTTEQVSINDAVKSYLFNTQLLTLPNGEMVIIAPTDCQENTAVNNYLSHLTSLNTPIKKVFYFDVKQSMQNGGGPACLRLRVQMTPAELAATNQHVLLTDTLFNQLNSWIDKYYRDQLAPADLADPQLLIESHSALDELTQLLHLGNIYAFQQ